MTYRTGNHWGVTIVREQPIDGMTATSAQLVAVVVNGDQALAERICALLNAETNPNCPWGYDCEGEGCSRCDWKGPSALAISPESDQDASGVVGSANGRSDAQEAQQ